LVDHRFVCAVSWMIWQVPSMSDQREASATRPAVASAASYRRSLLKIETPVVVSLATTRLPVGRILDLGPGAIIQFDKPYDQPLVLEVGGRAIAEGETVKVGEKFGLRVTAMIMPAERFVPLAGHNA
jgi:flagellar motor switch/type III secretory pathway protein FliN